MLSFIAGGRYCNRGGGVNIGGLTRSTECPLRTTIAHSHEEIGRFTEGFYQRGQREQRELTMRTVWGIPLCALAVLVVNMFYLTDASPKAGLSVTPLVSRSSSDYRSLPRRLGTPAQPGR
jgi:hypothetical protein